MKRYLIIEGKQFPIEDVAEALGVTLKRAAVGLQVEADGGSLEAVIPAASSNIPEVSVWFNHADPDIPSRLLSCVAQKDDGEGGKEVTSFLYDGTGCVVNLKHNVRLDKEDSPAIRDFDGKHPI